MKICSKCGHLLEHSMFSPANGGKYLRPECKSCARRMAKERTALRAIYGNPPQNHICPICLKSEFELKGTGGNAGIWVIDHDHSTGKFRGFICHNCNRGIGLFKDDIDRIKRIIIYLEDKPK